MSKSKGNVLDPLDIVDGISLEELLAKRTTGLMQPHLAPAIEKATRKQFPNGIEAHGTDALRFTFAALATQSRDVRFDLGRVAGYRNFCNKLWNAARFVLLMTDGKPMAPRRHRLRRMWWTAGSCRAWAKPSPRPTRPSPATASIWPPPRCTSSPGTSSATGTWNWPSRCCNGEDEAAAAATRRTLLTVLEALLRALHPLMPFITEEIWQRIAPAAGVAGETIMLAPWPRAADYAADAAAAADVDWMKGVILGLRQIRGEMDISPAQAPVAAGAGRAAGRRRALRALRGPARPAGRHRRRARAGRRRNRAALRPAAVVGNMTLLVPMQGLIDPAVELARLQKKQEKNQQEITRALAKLENPNFVNNAPPEVVATERERIAQFEKVNESLARQIRNRAGSGPVDSRPPCTARRMNRATRGPRATRSDHPRQAARAAAGAGLPAGARPPADRGRARRRQDHAGACAGAGAGPCLAARAVHQRPAAGRHPRRVGLRPHDAEVRVPPRAGVHPAAAGRRGQSRQPAHAERAARSHGRTAGQRRWHHASAARALLRRGHAESARAARHLSAARIAAGSLPDAHRTGLSGSAPRTHAAGAGRPARTARAATAPR